jgi:hypothetical protein
VINTAGYFIEHEGQGTYLKTTAETFDGIKKLLRNPRMDGRVSIVRRRDNFEIYCGTIQRARVHFGIS